MQNFFKPFIAMMLGVFLLASCAKEIDTGTETISKKVSMEDYILAQKIMDFHDAMMSVSTEIRNNGDGPTEYTPEDFLKNTEEAINYTYAVPFDKYWDVVTKKDTIPISIIDCKILASEGSDKYQQILNKIICKYNCSVLTNKKLKFAKVSLVSMTCSQLQVEVITSIASIDISATLGDPNPLGPSSLANFRRVFTQDLDGVSGLCNAPFSPYAQYTSTILTNKATYNIIGGIDLAHTVIEVEIRNLDSYFTPDTDWWYMKCYDPNFGESGGCGGWENCNLYYNTNPITGNIDWDSPTPLGADLECLTVNELNSILDSTESYCINQASAANKSFVNVDAFWNLAACFDKNYFWSGDLTLGKKLYRNQVVSNLPTDSCNCAE